MSTRSRQRPSLHCLHAQHHRRSFSGGAQLLIFFLPTCLSGTHRIVVTDQQNCTAFVLREPGFPKRHTPTGFIHSEIIFSFFWFVDDDRGTPTRVLGRRFKFHTHPKSHIQAATAGCQFLCPLTNPTPAALGCARLSAIVIKSCHRSDLDRF